MPDIFTSLRDNLEYCYELNRRATFKSWVFNDKVKCNAVKLAEAGFIFVGNVTEPDAVKCFLCNKQLDCWEEDDDPWLEHQKHAPQCAFAKLDKPEKSLTLLELMDIRNEFIESFLRNALLEDLNQTAAQFDEILDIIKHIKV